MKKFNKMLSVLLSLVLCLGMVAPAFAHDVTIEGDENTYKVDTVQEGVDKIADSEKRSGTITMTEDETTDSTITIGNKDWNDPTVDVTLNLNGNSITGQGDGPVIEVKYTGILTVNGGEAEAGTPDEGDEAETPDTPDEGDEAETPNKPKTLGTITGDVENGGNLTVNQTKVDGKVFSALNSRFRLIDSEVTKTVYQASNASFEQDDSSTVGNVGTLGSLTDGGRYTQETVDGHPRVTVYPNKSGTIDGIFYPISKLSDVELVIADGVTVINEQTLYRCKTLKSVTIPGSVKNIKSGVFEGCTNLESVTFGDGMGTIGWSVFSGCTSLTSVTFSGSVKAINNGAFSGCTSLTEMTIPDGVETIGYRVFYNCKSLTSVEIPDSVTSIGEGAFKGCTGLTSVTIPDNMTSIGEEAFYNCESLTSVEMPADVKIDASAFSNSPVKCVIVTGADGIWKDKKNDKVFGCNVYIFSGEEDDNTVTFYHGNKQATLTLSEKAIDRTNGSAVIPQNTIVAFISGKEDSEANGRYFAGGKIEENGHFIINPYDSVIKDPKDEDDVKTVTTYPGGAEFDPGTGEPVGDTSSVVKTDNGDGNVTIRKADDSDITYDVTGGEINDDGTGEIRDGGTSIDKKDGSETIYPGGADIDKDGNINAGNVKPSVTADEGGDNVTVDPGKDKGDDPIEVKGTDEKVPDITKNEDGSITVTVPEGGKVDDEEWPDGGKITIDKDGNITIEKNSNDDNDDDDDNGNGGNGGGNGNTVIDIPNVPLGDMPETGTTEIEDEAVPLAGLISRADVIGYLWQKAGSPEAELSDFADVPEDHEWAVAIGWAQQSGIAVADADGNFRPDDLLLRSVESLEISPEGELQEFLNRYAVYAGIKLDEGELFIELAGGWDDAIMGEEAQEILDDFFARLEEALADIAA